MTSLPITAIIFSDMYVNHISLTSIVQFDPIILMVFIFNYFKHLYSRNDALSWPLRRDK